MSAFEHGVDTASHGCKLCVVVPCFNEEACLRTFHQQLRGALERIPDAEVEILFVDDGSRDGTPQILAELSREDQAVRVLTLSRNFGHQIALTAGLDAADADAVVMMDSDLQHPPSLIPAMVAHWRAGSDIVSAVRQETHGASSLKRLSAAGFYRLINLLSDTHIVPGAADFCLLSRQAHRALISVRERNRFLRGIVSWIGFSRTFIPFQAPPRFAGQTKYSTAKMLGLAMSAIFSFSTLPLRLATRLGLLISAAGFAYFIYVLIARVFLARTVEGWTSLMSVVLILGGGQLIFTGLLGEYLAVIYDEAKRRPLYFIKEPAENPSQDKQPAVSQCAERSR